MALLKKHRILAGAVTALALSLPVPALAAGPANVTVRVEGQSQTLVPETPVTTTTARATSPGGNDCSGTSAIGALDLATKSDWDGQPGTVERIFAEEHKFAPGADANRYWTFWLNYQYQNQGACDTELQEGDDVLFFVDCYGDCPTSTPLRLEMPAAAKPDETVEAKVTEYSVTFDENYYGTTSSKPSAGASVEVGDRTYTTDANGIARIQTFKRGPVDARAVKSPYVRSSVESVCVSDGADGFCGSAKPGEPAPASPACVTTGDDGRCGTRDRRAPQARIEGIGEKQSFTRAGAPRELRGSVSADPSGLHAVKLRLSRRHGGRCWYFSPKKDGFRRTRCGRSFAFAIGDRADWSYLLPERLGRGRYVLDVIAIDKAFNRDALARGRNRVVFTVR